MPTRTRTLTTADVAAVIAATSAATDAQQAYRLVEDIAAQTCGFVLLTTLKFVEAEGVVERVHSSDPPSHPVGGRKPLDKLTESHGGDDGSVFLAATKADVARAFYDHTFLFEMGIGSILNAPIRHAGRRLGTLNLCGTDSQYGADDIATATTLAGLLVPCLLREGTAGLT
ncbi:MAG: GAF domain-containing protein [Hyphomicrobiaceae bacterium]